MASRGQRANGPDCEWLDLMVKNLKDELQRQLARVRDTEEKEEKSDARSRAADARTLASLQNTLERLGRLEQQRAMVRETKVRKDADGARAALERRLDKLLGPGKPGKPARKPE